MFKIRQDNKGKTDPTIYTGSAGVLYGLYKYSLSQRYQSLDFDMEEKLQKAINENIKIGEKLVGNQKSNDCASFFSSNSVGICTLAILNLLKFDGENLM